MFIGIISDTHGVFSPEFKEFLEPVDEVWHAGDFGGSVNFADTIAAFKPLKGVYGNCDGQDIRLVYPEYQCFECEGKRILMMHIGGIDHPLCSGYFRVRSFSYSHGEKRSCSRRALYQSGCMRHPGMARGADCLAISY